MYQNKAVLFTYVWFYIHAIDRNNYGKSYLLWSTPETTCGNENNTALCFIEIALPKRYQKEILCKLISWGSIFYE
jgi:hypothetical protein